MMGDFVNHMNEQLAEANAQHQTDLDTISDLRKEVAGQPDMDEFAAMDKKFGEMRKSLEVMTECRNSAVSETAKLGRDLAAAETNYKNVLEEFKQQAETIKGYQSTNTGLVQENTKLRENANSNLLDILNAILGEMQLPEKRSISDARSIISLFVVETRKTMTRYVNMRDAMAAAMENY